ncbi:MAG: uridine monophosphate kinase [Bacteroidetes bacterium]|nr:uridine monophosphate kinase [Bacteroidota bacterium]
MKYKRILLKLSGEALMGNKQFGIDTERISQYAQDIKDVQAAGVEIAIVIGGGNIFRGLQASESGMDRVQGDYMGMLATVINSMALQSYDRDLKVMDMTAFTLCEENKLPIIVFDMNKKGNLLNLVQGEKIGTLVTI